MRLAIPVETKNGLDSIVAHHFGRSPFFAIVDVEGSECTAAEIVENPYYAGHQPGQVPAFIHSQDVDVMLSGGMGGRAIQFFQQYGIQTATGASGTVASALQSYLEGGLSGAAPCKESVAHGH